MSAETVQIRILARSPAAAQAAADQLRAAGVELGAVEQGRKGDWMVYGRVSVDVLPEVEQPAPTPARRRGQRGGADRPRAPRSSRRAP